MNGDGPTELDWGAERRSLAADDRDELAAQRDRLAYGRDADAEQRQRAAETRSGWPAADAGGAPEAGWEYREEARIGAQTTTGGVVVVADTTTVSAPPPPCRTAAWITARIHRDF